VVITVKYPTMCASCGLPICVDERMSWQRPEPHRGVPTRTVHLRCPGTEDLVGVQRIGDAVEVALTVLDGVLRSVEEPICFELTNLSRSDHVRLVP
jgi:hypothetical protein